jgi:hypothetical protein
MYLTRSFVSWCLVGIFLMPSPRILDPERTHKRHATCEHHLKRHHDDPVDRARVLRRAERRKRRQEEEARIVLERIRAQQELDETAAVAETLDESNLQSCQAAADPPDEDSRMKKKRRPARIKTLFWSLQEPPKIRPAGDFLVMLRLHLDVERPRATDTTGKLEHYGSGPCHSIPRPREGTIPHCAAPRSVVA